MKTFSIERERRIPLTVTGLCLVSLLTFYMSSGGSLLLIVFAVSLVASQMTPYRVNNISAFGLILRVGVLMVAFFNNNGRDTKLMDAFIFAPALDFITHCFAAEMAMEPWLKWPPAAGRTMILLSGLVFFAGCATGETAPIVWQAPLYFLFLMLALRSFTSRESAVKPLDRLGVRIAAFVVVLLLGSYLQFLFRVHKDDIVQFGMEHIGDHAPQTSHNVTGIDKEAVLQDEFNTPGSSNRMLTIRGTIDDPHLHGMAYTTYKSNTWSPDIKSRAFLTPAQNAFAQTSAGTAGTASATRLVDDDGMVSAPLSCSAIQIGSATTPVLNREGAMLKAGDVPFDYKIVPSGDDFHQGPLANPITAAERENDLEVPVEIGPRLRNLTATVAPFSLSPAKRISAIDAYLLRNNVYANIAHFGGGDKVSAFVLDHKPGNCQYFASAAAIMLRLSGVPTRYVIGYYAHESDSSGGLVVRAQDAHAWCEAWLNGTGWVTVDATPGDGRPDKTAKTEWWWKWRDRIQDMVVAVRRFLASPGGTAKTALATILLVGLVVYAISQIILARREKTSTHAYTVRDKVLAPLAARFDRLLAAHGLPCPPERPWREHLASRADAPEVVPPTLDISAAMLFVNEYTRARFGADGDASQMLDQLLSEMERPIKAQSRS